MVIVSHGEVLTIPSTPFTHAHLINWYCRPNSHELLERSWLVVPQFGEYRHRPSITLTLHIVPTTTYVTLAPLTTYTQTINDKSTNHFFNDNISLHTHTTSSLPSTMKRTQPKSPTELFKIFSFEETVYSSSYSKGNNSSTG